MMVFGLMKEAASNQGMTVMCFYAPLVLGWEQSVFWYGMVYLILLSNLQFLCFSKFFLYSWFFGRFLRVWKTSFSLCNSFIWYTNLVLKTKREHGINIMLQKTTSHRHIYTNSFEITQISTKSFIPKGTFLENLS